MPLISRVLLELGARFMGLRSPFRPEFREARGKGPPSKRMTDGTLTRSQVPGARPPDSEGMGTGYDKVKN